MTAYTIKKSDLSVEGYFRRPAFALLGPKSNLHSTVTTFLSDFYLIQGSDIRINPDTNPLSNADVTYDLRPFNGFARVSIERTQLVLLSPHTLTAETITGLSIALLNAVHREIDENSYASFLIQFGFHAELQDMEPAAYTKKYVPSVPDGFEPIIGNAATYYLGQEGPRAHSSVTLDMSGEFSECVFVRIALRYDGDNIVANDLPDAAIQHCNQLLHLVGLDTEL